MTLLPGVKLGAFEVLDTIGAGGMGEVYRARDARLARDVAIKVLSSDLATDPVARTRFEREARAVAALSHPNILAIHDFGVQDDVAFAVLELLVGETLRQRLAGPPIPLRKTIDVATQIAHGLSAAHEHGIAHRDLKPENVFICTDGRVKILDFGLARSLQPEAVSDAAASDSQTMLRRTDPGTVLGTVGYMSPEQVRGLPSDQRSDIFAFGCVLFEMLTGRRAFQGDTAAETMTAILREEPIDLAKDSAPLPATLEPIVRHCLEKRPEDRFQSARDLAFVLQAQSSSSSPGSGRAGGSVALTGRERRSFLSREMAAVAVVGALAFAAGRYALPARSDAHGPRLFSFQQLTDMPGVETWPTLSPDGKSVVYSSDSSGTSKLYLMRVGTRTPVLLTGDSPEADHEPAWSPDGERIAFRSERDGGGIFVMTSTGESVRRLTDVGYSPSWSPDGAEIVLTASQFISPTDRSSTARGLWAIDTKSGRRRDIAPAHEGLQPRWSPHGWRIAAWGLRGGSGQRDIWTFAADGSDADHGGVTVTDDTALDWSPAWSPDGTHLYFASNRGGAMSLWRVGIDERTGRVTGEPEPMTVPSPWSGGFTLSSDGTTMAYASLDWRSTLLRVELDSRREAIVGPPVPILKSTRPIRDHELSPDGLWVAFMETGAQEDLFVARIDGTQYRRLTDDEFRDRAPTWSRDGKQLVFYSDRTGNYELWRIHPDGSGLEQVTAFGGGVNFATWSPDSSMLAFSGVNAKGWHLIPGDARALPLSDPMPRVDAGLDFWPFSWSSDGARIAGPVRQRDGTLASIGVYSLAAKTFRLLPDYRAKSIWAVPIWLSDGRRLVIRDDNGLSIINAETGASTKLLRVRGYLIGRSMGVSKDNRWITYTETGTEGDIWIAALKEAGR
jgi:eukaryotic-like serine/threonine-protein kinase